MPYRSSRVFCRVFPCGYPKLHNNYIKMLPIASRVFCRIFPCGDPGASYPQRVEKGD